MKRFNISIVLVAIVACVPFTIKGQYYQIANQLTNLIQAPLSGSFNYKGFVELSGVCGVGENRANIVGLSTTQGFKYANWFYMGAGLGLEYITVPGDVDDYVGARPDYMGHKSSDSRVMIPVFSDFRFDIGQMSSPSFFIDLKLGATWIMGDRYLQLQHGSMTGETQLYLKPTLGVRIPVTGTSGKQAFNIGVSYQYITSDNNYYRWSGRSVSLNGVGVSVAFDW